MGRSKLNPVDQHRKEARKKELKKNKKQRILVREAALKGHDSKELIEEMEKIDQMEYNVLQPSALSAKVLQEKRKKLRGTLERVLQLYAKDDQEKWKQLKDQLTQYERRRIELSSHFEAVRHAQQVQVDEIPLPVSDKASIFPGPLVPEIPLPQSFDLKENINLNISIDEEAPGVPAGPPPDFSEDEDYDSKEVKESAPLIVMPPPPPPREDVKLPPGPPPGLPSMLRPRPNILPNFQGIQRLPLRFPNINYQAQSYNPVPVLSAMPLINQRKIDEKPMTIEAKPQIRNLMTDATRFIPTSLRKKTDNPKSSTFGKNIETPVKPTLQKSKDDTYRQFMKEMKGFL